MNLINFFMEKRFNVFFDLHHPWGGNKKWLTTRRSMTTDDRGLPAELRQDLCALLGFPKVCLVGGLSSSKMKQIYTLPETNRTSPLKIGRDPKGNEKVFQPSIFRCYVSFREGIHQVIQAVTFLSPNVGLVTFTTFPKGHANSPSQKGHKELPGI